MDRQAAEALYHSGMEQTVTRLLEQQQQIQKLKRIVARLSKNSATSSKPPSSDIVRPKKSPSSSSKKRRIGGQHKHPRHEHALVDASMVDSFVDHHLQRCPLCDSSDLKQCNDNPRRLQQFELPQKLMALT